MSRLRVALGSVACFGLAALLSGCGAQDCGCGASPEAPLAEHDLDFPGDHELVNECACRCADGPLQPWPFDDEGGCDHDGVECIDDEGYPSELVCSG